MYKLVLREQVETISIPVLYLAKGISLVHKVKLAKADTNNNRDYFHKEYVYKSKYNNNPKITTLKLSHGNFLCVEGKRDNIYESLMINVNNRNFICKSLKLMKKYLKIEDLFVNTETAGFIVNPKLKNSTTISFEAYTGKAVVLKPCVIHNEDKEPIEGVSICLNPKLQTWIDIPADTFKTMIKLIKNFDFHQSSLLALNYLQATEIGNHETDMSMINNFPGEETEDMETVSKFNTQLPASKITGFAVSKATNIPGKGW